MISGVVYSLKTIFLYVYFDIETITSPQKTWRRYITEHSWLRVVSHKEVLEENKMSISLGKVHRIGSRNDVEQAMIICFDKHSNVKRFTTI